MQKPPKVYIVILNWNGWKDTIECLESVYRNNYANYQVIVCDNDSADGSFHLIKEWAAGNNPFQASDDSPLKHLAFPSIPKPVSCLCLDKDGNLLDGDESDSKLILMQTGGNLGFAGGNNVGLRHALKRQDADFVWLLNNDTVIEPDALSQMVEHSEQLRQTGHANTCGSLVCFYSDPDTIQACGGSRFNRWTGIASETLGRFRKRSESVDHVAMSEELDYITGCSWLLPIDYLKNIGLMEEKYFLYYEEIDWVTRANNQYKLTYAPKSIVYHKEGSSIGSKTIRRAPSLLAEYYMARSKVLFMAKFYTARLLFVYVYSLMQSINRIRQGFPKNSKTILKAIFGASR